MNQQTISTKKITGKPTLLFDPSIRSLYSLETYLNYTFIPNYISNNKVGIYTFIKNNSAQFIKEQFPTHQIEITQISEWQFYQLLFMPYATPNTDLTLYPLLFMGIIKNASDIHLSAISPIKYRCQFRINGALQTIPFDVPKKTNFNQLIQLHSHMNLSNNHKPQDGHIILAANHETHPMRVSSLPSYYGNDFVFRLFKKENDIQLSKLGFCDQITAQLNKLTTINAGLFLVTGPTGSGKTTTLYSILNQLKNNLTKNIITLEDPIEYPLKGIRQSQINTNSHYHFSQGLRAILRQDPDIIMIGEIRDEETAKIAIEAAYTGHFVLASLHTHTCKDALLRLAHFNIDPFFLTYSLKGILSQQLLPTSPQTVSGEWLSPIKTAPLINSYKEIDHYIQNCLHIPFQ